MKKITLTLAGWPVEAIQINIICNNQIVFYAQNRLAIYNTDTKETTVLADYVVIPQYDAMFAESVS